MKNQVHHRIFMKFCVAGLVAMVVCGMLTTAKASDAKELQKRSKNHKILVAYFSHTGNTRYVAEQIHSQVVSDLVEIKTVRPYPINHKAVLDQAKREQNMNFRPQLATNVPNLKSYDVIFIGYPNWWGTMPMALFTFFEKYDCTGKILIPFCTHEGSRFGKSISDLKALNPKATIQNGLAIRGRSARSEATQKDLIEWLAGINCIKAKHLK